MLQLAIKSIDTDTQKVLDALQDDVNKIPFFADKVEMAQSLWKSKGDPVGKEAFVLIKNKLYELCVFEGICNYCEQNEASDIEHIYPKSFFPEKTFDWENYLLACKQCNTGYKLDKCHVLDIHNQLIKVPRNTEPSSKVGAFINPRIENPNDFMFLNLFNFEFDELPKLSLQDSNKVKSTLEILRLNERDTLIAGRKSAARHYYDMMERLKRIRAAKTVEALQKSLSPFDKLHDFNQPIPVLQAEITESYKKYIQTYQHPSVWYAIKIVASKVDNHWKSIFKAIPEALNW